MSHAGSDALDLLEPLLAELRELPGLREKSRGAFYLRSRAFLHFHEDRTGLFADIRVGAEFERVSVTTTSEQRRLLKQIRAAL